MENLDEFFSESIDGWDAADVANVLSFFLLGAGPPHWLLVLLATCHMLPPAWLVAGVTVSGLLFAYLICLRWRPELINEALRDVVMFANSVYVIYSCTSVFWLFVPAYLCFYGEFPFPLDGRVAGLGSLALKFVEIMITRRMKKVQQAAGIFIAGENSLFRATQLDKISWPVRISALLNGISTAYKGWREKADNSMCVAYPTGSQPQNCGFITHYAIITTPARAAARARDSTRPK